MTCEEVCATQDHTYKEKVKIKRKKQQLDPYLFRWGGNG